MSYHIPHELQWINNHIGTNGPMGTWRNLDLRDKDLRKADLSHLDLSRRDLRRADLREANLRGARLSGANLECANLECANLECANLECANLEGTDLEFANLTEARLSNAKRKNLEFIRGKVLDAPILAYKYVKKDVVVKVSLGLCVDLIKVSVPMVMKLKVPTDSIVFCINGSKCRTNKVEVLELLRYDPSMTDIVHPLLMHRFANKNIFENWEAYEAFKVEIIDYLDEEPAYSAYAHDFEYRLGEKKKVKNFDMQYNIECSTGIHFFMTKEEVMDYIRKYAIVS